ncbi:MAG TPA: Zn-dependent hydrolase [Acidimicrobiales bacterium]|nr:Zn-dependent hydrolase [Acidimicrobiales bacterium]
MSRSGLAVDGERLLSRLRELGAIGATGDGGCSRIALTDADRDGRDLVVAWMRDLDLDVTVDHVGNVVGTAPGHGDGPAVMCGSHIDTVGAGGLYDGNYGVLAGLEVIETLLEHGVSTRHPIAVAFFTNEEGVRYAPDMMGSLVYAGGMTVEEARDITGTDGTRLGDELDRIGYHGATPCPGTAPLAYVELHIEQGPVLEQAGATIGAVTGVQGISWQQLSLIGQSNHAGTTPMSLRRDAAYAAARVTTFVRELAHEIGGDQVATVGRVELHPNLVNVVAGRATMTIDLRNTDRTALAGAEARLSEFVARLAAEEGVSAQLAPLARYDPVAFAPDLVDCIEAVAVSHGHTVRRMPSGAGHDAQMLARVCPAAMIFVPSAGGVSHNPAEHTDPAQLTAGANVLLHVLLRLAGET